MGDSTSHISWRGKAIGLLDLDAFFASVEVHDHPEWKGKPLIVGGDANQRGVVSTCNYEARAFGVHSAMASAQAKRLCPDAIWVEGHYERYQQMSRQVMQIILDETPRVQQVSIDEAFFDVTPGRFSQEDPRTICRRIQSRVDELGITCSIGLSTSKTVSKIASEVKKPHGFVFVSPGAEAQFLAPMPVGAMSGVGKRADERLRSIGIRTLGQLAAADQELLSQLFGTMGPTLKLRAAGNEHSEVLLPEDAAAPKSISSERTFPHDLTSQEELEAAIDHVAGLVARRLRKSQLKATTVTLKLHYSWTSHKTQAVRLDAPTDNERPIAKAARKALANLWSPSQQVRLVGIATSGFDEVAPQQLTLFSPTSSDGQEERELENQRQEKLSNATDAIKERFGNDALSFGYDLRFKRSRDA